GQLQFTGRVIEDMVVPRQPLEPGPDGQQAVELRAKGERLAVGLAVVKQEALVTFQDRLGDFARLVQATLLGPGNEASQIFASADDRLVGKVMDRQPFQELAEQKSKALRIAVVGQVVFAGHGCFSTCEQGSTYDLTVVASNMHNLTKPEKI